MKFRKTLTALIALAAVAIPLTVLVLAADIGGDLPPASEAGEQVQPTERFPDVSADAWYADAVDYCESNGLMSGTTRTAFSPGAAMTHSMLATVLYRAAGSPAVTGEDSFTDTDPSAYYADAVVWASEQDYISGYGNGLFGTDDPVSREQLATILWRYDGGKAAQTAADYPDSASISTFAVPAVNWATERGFLTGASDGGFAPKESATRAQVAVLLHRYLAQMPGTPTLSDDAAKALVVYFSRVGNTNFPNGVDAVTSASINVRNGELVGNNQLVAEAVHDRVGGDLVEIVSREPYPLDYDETVS